MMPLDSTAPDKPAASANGTVRPSDMPITMSRTNSEPVKCVSGCGWAGLVSGLGKPVSLFRRYPTLRRSRFLRQHSSTAGRCRAACSRGLSWSASTSGPSERLLPVLRATPQNSAAAFFTAASSSSQAAAQGRPASWPAGHSFGPRFRGMLRTTSARGYRENILRRLAGWISVSCRRCSGRQRTPR